ncbi:hypothetical protein MMC11_002613 [Xylographa trunciseda]|nr:hypothetical protein [Xylographa trunciseda]
MASPTLPSPAKPQPSDLDGEAEKNEQDLSSPPSDDLESESTQVLETAPTAPPATQKEPWVSGIKLLNIISALTLVCLLVLLDTSIIATAIPYITSDFHSLTDVGWYGGAYQLASATLVPLTGKLFMNFNTKWTFMAFFALFQLGSLICGVAKSSTMLIVGRAIAGMGTAGLYNGTFIIIAGCVPMAKRPNLIGYVMGISNLGLVMGPLIGGALTQYTTWRWCFYINLPCGGLVAAMLAFVHVPDQISKPKPMAVIRTIHTKLDLLGFALFAPAAIQFLLALQYGGNTFAWNSAQVIGLFCGAGGTFVVFLAWEYYKGDAAMIPFSMVRKRTIWASSVVFGFFMAQLFSASYYLPIYFQGVKGASPLLSGVYLLPGILGQLFSSIATGMLVGRIGYYLPFMIISSIMGAIASGLLSTLSPGTSVGKWIGYQILLGVGRGLGFQIVSLIFLVSYLYILYYPLTLNPLSQPIIAVQNTLPPMQIPTATALVFFSQNFVGALYLTLSDTIFTNSLVTLIPQYAPSVNPQSIINAGATGFRTLINGEELANVLVAYATSIDRVFYLTAGAAVVCFTFGWFLGWKDIRKKDQVSKA